MINIAKVENTFCERKKKTLKIFSFVKIIVSLRNKSPFVLPSSPHFIIETSSKIKFSMKFLRKKLLSKVMKISVNNDARVRNHICGLIKRNIFEGKSFLKSNCEIFHTYDLFFFFSLTFRTKIVNVKCC